MKTKYLVANWKSNKTGDEALEWLVEFRELYQGIDKNLRIIIAPPLVHVAPMRQMIRETPFFSNIFLAAQDISPFPMGSYCGAVAAEILVDVVDYVITGHAERRRYFHETISDVASKASEALAVGITPILCLDRPYIRSQLAALQEDEYRGILVCYDPAVKPGNDLTQTPEMIASVVSEIRSIVSEEAEVICGGRIDGSNAEKYLEIPGVVGLVAGSASLDPAEFAAICIKAAPK